MQLDFEELGAFLIICAFVFMGIGYLIGNGIEYLFAHISCKG